MSEPRLTIRNLATNHLLYASDWEATTTDEEKAGNRDALFKVQWCERINDKIVTTVLIRTDCHPQSLLDVRNLKYQGGALDGGKCYDKHRWWKLTWLEVAERGAPTVLFQSFTNTGKYLVEKENNCGVELMEISGDTPMENIPDRAKWELTIGGRALSPGQATSLCLTLPVATVLGIISGGAAVAGAVGPLAAIFTAAGATTLAGAVTTTGAIAAGAALGGIAAAAKGVVADLLKDVSSELFVDW